MKILISFILFTTLCAVAAMSKKSMGQSATSKTMTPEEQQESERREAKLKEEKQQQESLKKGPYDKDGNYTYDIHTEADDEAAQENQ